MIDSNDEATGTRILQALKQRGLKPKDLADHLDVEPSLVSHWIKGRKSSKKHLAKISKFLNVDAVWLDHGKGEGPVPDAKDEIERYRRETGWRTREAYADGARDYGNASMETFNPDIANMVREGLQNILDVRLPKEDSAKVVFRIIRLRGADLKNFQEALQWDELSKHLDAASEIKKRHGQLLKSALDKFNERAEMLLLVVEDSGTKGLIGPEYEDGNFLALTKNNLDSNKDSKSAQGSYGLGKVTWWRMSQFFVVLFNSHLSEPTAEGQYENRIIGRCELPWHEDVKGETACAGPGWFGRLETHNDTEVAESYWGNATLAKNLHLERKKEVGPGTSICVVGFHDPSSDDLKDPRDLAKDIETAVADHFWPVIVAGKLKVAVETWEGAVRSFQADVQVGSHKGGFVDAYSKYRAHDLAGELKKDGDVVCREISIQVPARTAADGRHDALEHSARLIVRRATPQDLADDRRDCLAVFRGPGMVVEYVSLRHAFSGAMPFHAVLVCGEAAAENPDNSTNEERRAERFLRTAEPAAHNKWTMTPDLKAHYEKGGKKSIDQMFQDAKKEIGELVRPSSSDLTDGPNALKELLAIGEDPPPPVDQPRIVKSQAKLDENGRWNVEARVRVRPSEDGWRYQPVLLFGAESGGGFPVAWETLEAVSGCTAAQNNVEMPPGEREAVFRGITDAASHPIQAEESTVMIDIRRIRAVKGAQS